MKIGVVKETYPGEKRVALVPGTLPSLTKAGCHTIVESHSGAAAGFPDREYEERGAKIAASRDEVFRETDVIVQVRALGSNLEEGIADLGRFREGQALVGFCDPLSEPEAAQQVAARGVSLLSMELIPRITRAQSMDALSSMATIAGYKAALLAAEYLPKMFPMMMTAAGTITPAKVFVVGAGVAGLQAIASSRRMGAMLTAYDVRPEVKEQIESLGAKFLVLPLEAASGEGGYAKAQGEEFYARQRQMMAKAVAEHDVTITTAAVPGRKAPVLVTAEMVRGMTPGSVIVDLAAERGGNCELTQPGETVLENGVTILGPLNLPSRVPYHASQMYAKNISTLLLHLIRSGKLDLDADDEIVKGTVVARGGKVVHPAVLTALEQRAGVAADGVAKTRE